MKKRKIIGLILFVILFIAAFLGLLIYAKLNLLNRVTLNDDELHISDVFTQQEAQKEPSEEETGVAEEEDDNPYTGFEIVALVGLDTRDASELANSDTMIFACINHDERYVKLFSLYRDTLLNIGNDTYRKANAAYCSGGPEKFLSMINLNLDLNVTKFVTTNFNALADTIDILGGLDLDLTREELIHMNNYNVETSKVCGKEYEAIPVPDDVSFDGARTRTFHLNGTQAVSYARIRYTAGWDYKRTERQRLLLYKIRDKVVTAGIPVILKICNAVFPQITTNLENDEIIQMARYCIFYDIIGSEGFPYDKQGLDVDGMDAVVPMNLESNVVKLHEYIYPGVAYTPSEHAKTYSSVIESKANGSFQSTVIPEETVTPTPEPTKKPVVTEAPQPTVAPEPQPEPQPEPAPDYPEDPGVDPQPEPQPEPEPVPEPGPEPEVQEVFSEI